MNVALIKAAEVDTQPPEYVLQEIIPFGIKGVDQNTVVFQ